VIFVTIASDEHATLFKLAHSVAVVMTGEPLASESRTECDYFGDCPNTGHKADIAVATGLTQFGHAQRRARGP
jgi:hypothetical protein